MSGSTFGKLFTITTWGESHGYAMGVVIDGCPSGIKIDKNDIQKELESRKPGLSEFSSPRNEEDEVQILSGVFEGITLGTPISLIIFNKDCQAKDYEAIKNIYRPGHGDYGYEMKYGIRDYRGGGRSSGRETVSRVAAGAIAKKILEMLNIDIMAYCTEIAGVSIERSNFDIDEISKNSLCMPDRNAYEKAAKIIRIHKENKDSVGGIVEVVVKGLKPGIGEPIFEKIDAMIGQAILSIGATKSIEFGAGINVAKMTGSENNDIFYTKDEKIMKKTNNSGGVLGGLTDGDDLVFRVSIKPTSSIGKIQETLNKDKKNVKIEIDGRHDPVIVPRSVAVIEAMTAITLVDYIMQNTVSKMDNIITAF